MKLNALRIVEFTNPSGAIAYRVDGKNKDGNRVRENFKTRGEAIDRKQELEAEIENLAPVARIAWRWKLTEAQVDTAQVAYDALDGKDLMQAVRYYLDNYREPVTKCDLQKALDEFIAEKKLANCRPRTLENQKNRVRALIKNKHEGKNVSDITRDHVLAHIHRPNVAPLTKNTDLQNLSGFFAWAVDKGYCQSNPCAKIEPVKYDAGEVQILPLKDVATLFEKAAEFKGGELVPYLALATFCALRPSEAQRVQWSDIDLAKKIVRVRSDNKTRSRRNVEISDNCLELLAPHALKKTPIKPKNFRRKFDAVRKLAGYSAREDEAKDGLKPWPADCLRHTGGSHHFCLNNEVATAKWMGNSPAIVHEHYNALPDKDESEAFWRIGTKASNIIDLKKAA